MGKPSQLDRLIASLEAERAVLDLAIAKLREQQQTRKLSMAVVRSPRRREKPLLPEGA